MFRKLTAIEPVSLEDWAEEKLHTFQKFGMKIMTLLS